MSLIHTHTSLGYARVCAEAIVLAFDNRDEYNGIRDWLDKIAYLGETMRKHVKDCKANGIEVNEATILEAEGILQESVDNKLTKEEFERNKDLYRQVEALKVEQQKRIDKDCGRTYIKQTGGTHMKYEVESEQHLFKKLVSLKIGTAFTVQRGSIYPVFLVSHVSYTVRKEGFIPCYELRTSTMFLLEEDTAVYPLAQLTNATFRYTDNGTEIP